MGIALITNNILSDSGTAVAGLVPTSRTISTTAPLTGGGDLSADRTIAIPAATSSVNGFLSAADWTTFNSKQNALTNPVTGSGTTNYLPKFTGTSTIGNSQIFDNGTNVLIGTNVAQMTTTKLEVIGSVIYDGVVRFINSVNQGDVNHGTLMIVNTANYAIGNDASIGFSLKSTGGSLDPRASIGVKTSGDLSGDIVFNTRTQTDYTEKVRIFAGGNMAIGTQTNSGFKLDVNGTGRFTGSVTADFVVVGTTAATSGGLRLGTQVAIRARNVANTANIPLIESTATDAVAIASGGALVGINTTSPGTYVDGEYGAVILQPTNGRAVLSLVGTRVDADEALGRLSFTNTNATTAGSKRLAHISGYRGTTNNSAYLEFATANDSIGVGRMWLTQAGNLGIGTINPDFGSFGAAEKILGVSNASERARLQLQNTSTGTTGVAGTMAFFNGSTQLGSIDIIADGATNKGRYVFNTNDGTSNSARLTILNTGAATFSSSVTATQITTSSGVALQAVFNATSNNPYIRFDESGSAKFFIGNRNSVSGGTGTGYDLYTVASNDLRIYSGGAFNTVFATNGNVGINTTTPGSKLQVEGGEIRATTSNAGVAMYATGGNGEIAAYNWAGSAYVNLSHVGLIQTFSTGSSPGERMRITSGGNVLIGTTTDAGWKLDVNGWARFTPTSSSSVPTLMLSQGGSYANIAGAGDMYHGIILRGIPAAAGDYSVTAGDQISFYEYGGIFNFYKKQPGVLTRQAYIDNGNFYGSAYFETSDATIKTLITDNYQAKGIESVVAKLYTKNGREELGYYAQDVQGILPSAVNKGLDGLLSLSYREVHTAKISALEKRVAELEQQLNLN